MTPPQSSALRRQVNAELNYELEAIDAALTDS
jgi:hypothetical protein